MRDYESGKEGVKRGHLQCSHNCVISLRQYFDKVLSCILVTSAVAIVFLQHKKANANEYAVIQI